MSLIDYDLWDYDLHDKDKFCIPCDGRGYYLVSDCCGSDIEPDMLICYECKEHSDFAVCENCENKGLVSLIEEEILELEYNDACNRADDFIKDQKESK
tara:strand:- start:3300 stop:3593 length:294 start_codon:yes stop_codon:yes gene_type:complete